MPRGFTLLEVLVVMLIIGVLATTLSLSLALDAHRALEDEAYRLARVLEQGVEAARAGEALGLVLEPGGYAFHRQLAPGRWRSARDDFLAPHRWPDTLRADILHQPSTPPPWPMWQAGQAPWLQLRLSAEGRRLSVELTPPGRVTVREVAP